MIKPIAALTLAATLAACGPAQVTEEELARTVAAAEAAVPAGTRLVAATVHADWCGSCKVLEPKVTDVAAETTELPVAFLKLDYTAKDKGAFYAAADAAGIGDAVRAELGDTIKTGQLLLIDLDDQTVVSVLKKDASEADIKEAVATSAASA